MKPSTDDKNERDEQAKMNADRATAENAGKSDPSAIRRAKDQTEDLKDNLQRDLDKEEAARTDTQANRAQAEAVAGSTGTAIGGDASGDEYVVREPVMVNDRMFGIGDGVRLSDKGYAKYLEAQGKIAKPHNVEKKRIITGETVADVTAKAADIQLAEVRRRQDASPLSGGSRVLKDSKHDKAIMELGGNDIVNAKTLQRSVEQNQETPKGSQGGSTANPQGSAVEPGNP